MCGIIGVMMADLSMSAAVDLHEALYLLQHRGQDACGLATCGAQGVIYQCKGNGMAASVFQEGQRIAELSGGMGIGHLRYPTAGSSSRAEAQPFYVNSPYGICFAHNGNLVNTEELKDYLDRDTHRHINTDSDSEVMLNIFASTLQETGKFRVNEEDLFNALTNGIYARCKGAYACTAMLAGFGMMGFRDPYGIRPLCLGKRPGKNGGFDYMLASESVAPEILDFKDIVDILPGHAVIIKKGKAPIVRKVCEPKGYTPDIFEFVYFARPDTVIDKISVHTARQNMGSRLAGTIKKALGEDILKTIDAVIPIPETSNTAAAKVAEHLDIPYVQGFVKNRYVFRTFIMPGQNMRKKTVRRKLHAIKTEFDGKVVLLIDDSIVRGTTSFEIVQMAREAGATKVYLASCSPPVRYAHVYGIDIADRNELVGHNRTEEEICKEIRADAVIYQSLEDLVAACGSINPDITNFEVGVFSGKYVTGISHEYVDGLEERRGVRSKEKTKEAERLAASAAASVGAGSGSEKTILTDVALHNIYENK